MQNSSRRNFLKNLSLLAMSALPFPPVAAGVGPSHSSVQFTDITDSAGISFRHISAPQKKYIVESMSGGVALFDYDNDGWLDIYSTNALTVETAGNPRSSRSALYHNNRDGTFTDATEKSGLAYPGWAMGVAAADFDSDGFQDLYVTCLGPNHLYHNNGDGTFTDVTAKAGVDDPRWSTGAAFGDIDNDGDIDIVIENLDGKPTILRNDGGNRNNWISIKLQGNGPNRDAIGARVKVVADDFVQWGEVHAGGSYLSSSDLRLHFGLEKRTAIDLIEVHWPDGRVEPVRKIAPNHFVTIQEGKGTVNMAPARR